MEQSSSLRLFGRVFLVAILVLLAIWILRPLLPALAWAGVLALATWPAREWLIRKGMSSSSAAISLTLLAGILIVGPLIVLAIAMAREALVVVRTLQELREVGLGTPLWVPQVPFLGEYMASWWQDHLADPDAVKELLGRAESMDFIHWTRSLGSEAVNRLVILAFTLLTLLFAYRDGLAITSQSRIIADRLFGPLHALDLGRFLLDRHEAVDDANAALASHRAGHARFGDRVHIGRHDRDVQPQVAGQPRARIDVAA